MIRSRRFLFCLSPYLLLLALAGCREMDSTVVGSVMYNGSPVEQGKVLFYPEGGGAAVIGTINSDGTFALKTGTKTGLNPGEYKVSVTSFTSPPSPMMSPAEVDRLRAVPAIVSSRKTTPLRYTVDKGSNVIDIDVPEP